MRGRNSNLIGWRFRWKWILLSLNYLSPTSRSLWQFCGFICCARRIVGQTHCNCRHLTHDLCLHSVAETAHAHRRERVRQEQQVAFLKVAPRTSVSVTQFHKVNRTVMLGAPARRTYFADALV